jgi:hypothetical protein
MRLSPFERFLSVSAEETQFELRGFCRVPWSEFLLNPRRLRGSDFLMRWSQGVWSEQRLREALDDSRSYFALPYGPSGVAPDNDPRAFELYFERLDKAGLAGVKRPDLLVFKKRDRPRVEALVERYGGPEQLPFTEESRLVELLSCAVIAVECENSLWMARRMPAYGTHLTPQRRSGGRLGLKKTAVLPTVIVKNEDLPPLARWEEEQAVPVHVWHVFFDLAFGIPLKDVQRLIKERLIEPTVQVFQAPGGATTKKVIYKVYYQYAYELGEARSQPTLRADYIEDKNGHILPYVRFEGGILAMRPEVFAMLDKIAERSR